MQFTKTKKKTKAPTSPAGRGLTKGQVAVLGLAGLIMCAVGVAGGIGTYANLSGVYGSGTALGALAAGEGATVVLALLLLGVTMLGQTAPVAVRAGLWLLPAVAGAMGATAATGAGEMIVFAATPMGITASAEGLAFLARRIVVHKEQRDIEAEERASRIVRELAYHQARAARHPSDRVRKRSAKTVWRLARRAGRGDVALGVQLMDVQRVRVTEGADAALSALYGAAAGVSAPALGAGESASGSDATASRSHDAVADGGGYPADTTSALVSERDTDGRRRSVRAAVRDAVAAGATDAGHLARTLAGRFNREPGDARFRETVARYVRDAKDDQQVVPDVNRTAGYL